MRGAADVFESVSRPSETSRRHAVLQGKRTLMKWRGVWGGSEWGMGLGGAGGWG